MLQVLHEFTILREQLAQPGQLSMYGVVCIFGEEFAINWGKPEIAGYERWLKAHRGMSPLHMTDILPGTPHFPWVFAITATKGVAADR